MTPLESARDGFITSDVIRVAIREIATRGVVCACTPRGASPMRAE